MSVNYHVIFSAGEPNKTACDDPYDPYCFPPSPASPAPAPSPAPFPVPSPSPAAFVAAAAPWPLFLPLPSGPTVTDGKHNSLRAIVIVVASVLATCALLLTYYAVLRRYRSLRRRAALAAGAGLAHPAPDTDEELHQDLLVGGGGADEPYHVWLIRTAGLDEPTIGAISAVAYRRGEGVVEGTDCAVCLGEFREGEMLRLLPKCSHAFHIPCIDTWLRSHVNCPLCRAPILAPPPDPAPPNDATSIPGSSSSSLFSSAAASDLGPITAAVTIGGTSTHPHVASEERGEDGNTTVPYPSPALVAGGHHPGSSLSHDSPEVWVQIDLGDGGSEDEGSHTGSDTPAEEETQHVRRSVSMDSSALGGLLLRMGLVGTSGEDGRKPTSQQHPSVTKEGTRKVAPLLSPLPEMERSMSSGGGRFFLSRFSGRARSAILPL